MKTNFTAGEISPHFAIRDDTEVFHAGVLKMKNAIPLKTGGFENIKEFAVQRWITGIDTSAGIKFAKYLPLVKGVDQWEIYVLFEKTKFHVLAMRFYDVVASKTFDTGETFEDVTRASVSQIKDSLVICHPHVEPFILQMPDHDLKGWIEGTNEITVKKIPLIDNLNPAPMIAQDIIPGPTLSSNAKAGTHQFVMYTHKGTVYLVANKTDKTKTRDTFSQAFYDVYGGKLTGAYYEALGGKFKIYSDSWVDDGTYHYQVFKCTVVNVPKYPLSALADSKSPTSVTEIKEQFGGQNIEYFMLRFYRNIFSTTHPSICLKVGSRLILAGIEGEGDCYCASKPGQYFNFTTGTTDGDAFVEYLPGTSNKVINQVIYYKSLIFFTDKGVDSTTLNERITPATSITFPQNMITPSLAPNSYVEKDGNFYYISKNRNKIILLKYVGDETQYLSEDITKFSDHLFDNIESISILEYENNDFLIVKNTGDTELRVGIINLEEGLYSWGRAEFLHTDFTLAGCIDVGGTNAIVVNDAANNRVGIGTLSSTRRLPLEVELFQPPRNEVQLQKGVDPLYMSNSANYKTVKIVFQGDDEFTVNEKPVNYKPTKELFKVMKTGQFLNPRELKIKQSGSGHLKILGILNEGGV